MDSSTDAPVTLITGPAGSGKTTLAASWARLRTAPWPAVWLTLDADDKAPGVFWAYVLEAFRRHLVALPGQVGTPARPDDISHSLLARLVCALDRLPQPVVLVLDGLDKLSGREVPESLQFVLDHARARLRLVLISRVDPLLPLHRYRAEDRLSEIRGADLAFTRHEAEELLRRHGLSVARETVAALSARTEGWAAGLRLCALAMQRSGDPDGFARSLAASQHAVADYLLAEVLHAQPADTQELLLRTSLLREVHPDLATALTGRQDTERILTELTRTNTFVEPVADTPWCRFHPLFAEVLHTYLRTQRPGLEPHLHRRAARWLADAGQVSEALGHAAAAGDWRYGSAKAIEHLLIGNLLTGPETDRLQGLFSRIPGDAQGAEPAIVTAACRLSQHDPAGCRQRLAEAERQLQGDGAQPEPEVRLALALLRLLSEPYGEDGDRTDGAAAVETARQVGELMEQVPQSRLKQHPEIEALRRYGHGCTLMRSGRLEDARNAFSDAVVACTTDGTSPVRHNALARLALVESFRGMPVTAEDYALRSAEVAERHGMPAAERSGAGHLALATVAFERGDLHGAHQHLEWAGESPDTPHDSVLAAQQAILRSRLALSQGQWETALGILTDGDRADESSWSAERLSIAHSAIAQARGDTTSAIDALDAAASGSAAHSHAVALAHAHLSAGRADQALRPLSGREREVLELVAQMMTTDEIAQELHLSVNTVKTHLRSVYRKLCVSRRRDAVLRGKELHLL